MQTSSITLDEAVRFAWHEADLLDHAAYDEWLALWAEGSHYVVPIEPGVEDFANTLNYAYDDAAMRIKRVERLTSGQSVSASPVAITIRSQSRFRMLDSDSQSCSFRCAQIITEMRRGRERTYTGNVSYRLRRGPNGHLLIAEKVIRLINATEALMGIGYIL